MKSLIDRRRLLAGATALVLAPVAMPVLAQDKPARPSPAQFARTKKVEEIALSPDAKRIAYFTREGAGRILVILDLAGSARKYPMDAEKVRALFWASPEHVIFETSITTPIDTQWQVGEYYQAHVFNINSGKVFTLFDVPGYHGIVYGGMQVIKRDGKYSLTAANVNRTTESITLFEFDLTRASGDFLDGGREGTSDWAVTADGKLMGRENVENAGKNIAWILEMFIDGKWKEIYRKTVVTDSPSLSGIGRDGKSLVIYISEEGQGGKYYEISAAGEISEPLFGGEANTFPAYHPTTRRLCGSVRSGDWPTYQYDDPVLAGIVQATEDLLQPGERVSRIDYAEDPRKVILYTEGPNNAGAYFYADFTTGDITPLLQNYPDVPAEWISDKKLISYKASDGLSIPAYLTLPPFREPRNLPLVVLVHGGPQSRDTLAFDWEAQVYASRGYAVLQPNYRGSGGYGWDWLAKGFGEYGRKMQTDLSDGVRHLVAQGTVAAGRVAIAGASYGGYAALMGATVDRGVYCCAIDVAGVSDPEFSYLNTNFKETPYYRWATRMLGTGSLDEISPLKNAAKADIPILIIHGRDDTVVSMVESERMAAALKKAGKDFTFIKLEKEDHWQSTEAGRTEMMSAIVPFLEKHNPA